MAEIASAFVSLLPSAKGFGKKLDAEVSGDIQSSGKRLGTGFGKMFAAGAGVLAAAGIGSFLKDSIGEARESQKVGALTENVIRRTGSAANVTAKQVGDLASSFSSVTGVDDEVIQSGSNLLLTFKNVRNEAGLANNVFDRATRAAVDLSAAGFGSVESASKQLGKALNDPVKGITALSRSGVTFTDGQKKQIEGFVASNDLLSAQKIILGELNSQVGGAAAASATSGEKAAVAFGNLKEQIGTALLPLVDRLADAFVKAAPSISRFIAGIGPALSKVGDFLAPAVAKVREFASLIGANIGPAFAAISGFLAPVIAKVSGFFSGGGGGGLISGIQSFASAIQANFVPVLQTAAATFTGTILPAVISFASYIGSTFGPIISRIGAIIRDQVIPIVASLATFFYGTLYPAVVAIATSVASRLAPIFTQLAATFQSQVLPAVSKLLARFQEAQPTIQRVIAVVVKVIGAVLKFAASVLGNVIPVVIRFAGFLLGKVVPAVASMIAIIAKIIGKVLDFGSKVVGAIDKVAQFQKGVREKFGQALDFIKGIPGKALDALGNLGSTLFNAGSSLIQGLIDGVTSKIASLRSKLSEITNLIPDLKGPPKKDAVLLRPAGRLIMGGLVAGFDDGVAPMEKKLGEVTEKIGKAAEKMRDKLTEKLKGLRSAFASLSSSVSQAFVGNLFEPTTAGSFISNLLGTKGELTMLKAAFKKLQKYGLSPAFLSQLFASGNGGLILDLAAGSKAQATQAASLFGQVNSLGASLGNQVAQDKLGSQIKGVRDELKGLRKENRLLAREIGDVINGAANDGRRRGARA